MRAGTPISSARRTMMLTGRLRRRRQLGGAEIRRRWEEGQRISTASACETIVYGHERYSEWMRQADPSWKAESGWRHKFRRFIGR